MAINQLNPTGFSYSDLLAAYNKSYKTQADITITNYDDDTAPQVTAGSIFANSGSQFENTALATPTGYAGIANSTTFYLYYDESGGVFIFSSTTPVWSDALQGWYNGNDRAFFSMYKDSGGTLYQNKTLLVHNILMRETVITAVASADPTLNLLLEGIVPANVRGISPTIDIISGFIDGWRLDSANNRIVIIFGAATTGTVYATIFHRGAL